MTQWTIFLNGPIGAGKTTLGRALAGQLGGGLVDGDDFSVPGRPWYGCILQTCRGIVTAGNEALACGGPVVIAYPLRCMSWIYFRRRFGDAGVGTIFVSLRASYASIVADSRGRRFSADEHERIREMIAQGYGEKPFSDLVVDTDQADFATTLAALEAGVRRLMVNTRSSD